MNSYLKSIRNHINQDQLAIALQKLGDLLENSPLLNEAILQTARFNDLRREIRLGTITKAEEKASKEKIQAGVLDLLCEIDELEEQPEIQQEMERAIAIINSKQVITGNYSGNQTQIGDQFKNRIKGNNNTIIQGIRSEGDTNITIGKSDQDGA
ncbi:hypothetical protein [Flavilitoribacter nigricans]|uniref:Effector-associated domain-containing protein n=1 Tax=Flavilitoribacter nigricans (strain ATCC 23147 / DSM 23189 / NBRC 102662 / NCIMB 1420 / SS-2) TaxID=1122177 RepID=A0A2D0NH18_FLAN2|nr:hypothetical protein [Flavilitoribacter nigricans]PHN07777.1 hypothetical protein CRP01_04460 [Flavilitoribacter nigricans DSM 23189 = NBRC 102662]